MNTLKKVFAFFCLVFFCCLMACNGSPQTAEKAPEEKVEKAPEKTPEKIAEAGDDGFGMADNPPSAISRNGITLMPMPKSPVFKDAQLGVMSPTAQDKLKPGTIGFEYAVNDYELGTQTPDANEKMCANSGKGQHIHHIVNNKPYTAHYTNKFDKELKGGNYLILSFLSRSYHESLKHPGAAVLQQLTVGNPKAEIGKKVLEEPHLFYSRPKGTYVGADIENVMLDFYLVNTNLAMDGNKVRVTINDIEFVLHDWRPYFMQGLPEGENKIKLELIDAGGKLISGPFNKVERTFELYKSEPLKK